MPTFKTLAEDHKSEMLTSMSDAQLCAQVRASGTSRFFLLLLWNWELLAA